MIIIPLINSNGNTKESLERELAHARFDLEVAIKSLKAAEYANGRNYQLQSSYDKHDAYQAHCQRVQDLERIAHELLEIQYGVSTQ